MPDSQHVLRNRAEWDRWAPEFEEVGHRNWSSDEPTWGIWDVPDYLVGMMPDVHGKDVVELGCGTAYVSAWVAKRGGRPVGVDNSSAQLASARRFQSEFGLRFPLIQADVEAAPLADATFDVAISEYGASIWCDPYGWIPEAARLLRPGGELVFLVNGSILMLCVPDEEDVPAGERLLRPYFDMHRFEWSDDDSVEFHLGYGDWIRLLRSNGFEIENLKEIQPPEGSTTSYPFVTLEWARRWPSEEVWKARRAR